MCRSGQFSDTYFAALFSDRSSTLYQELENLGTSTTLSLEGNRILQFLFDDANTAKEFGVWNSIAKTMLDFLNPCESPDQEFTERLKLKSDDFESEKWSNPIYVGIYFFDRMVTVAAYQRIMDHMSLTYFMKFIEGLEKLYDISDDQIEESHEFPNRSAWLIYEAISVLSKWVYL